MLIHTVKRNDTLGSIASEYNIPKRKLEEDNLIKSGDPLPAGRELSVTPPSVSHTVSEGENLYGICEKYSVTPREIYRNNPSLFGNSRLIPGKILNIAFPTRKLRPVYITGFAYPEISRNTLTQILPYLTCISVISHRMENGRVCAGFCDTGISTIANLYGVSCMMTLSNTDSGGNFSDSYAKSIFMHGDGAVSEICDYADKNEYAGVNLNFAITDKSIAEEYRIFAQHLRAELHNRGKFIAETVSDASYYGHHCGELSFCDMIYLNRAATDAIIGENAVTIRNAKSQEPVCASEKISFELDNFACRYRITSPENIECIDCDNAYRTAKENRCEIRTDLQNNEAIFRYIDKNGKNVIFREIRYDNYTTYREKIKRICESGSGGISIMNVNRFNPDLFNTLSQLCDVEEGG